MEMILGTISVSGVMARAVELKPIPQNLAGAKIQILYEDAIWNKLQKTVVFEGSGVTKDIINAGGMVTIPHEVVRERKSSVRMGIYGHTVDGTVIVPSLWITLGTVQDSVEPSGDESTDPVLPVWAQLDSRVKILEEVQTDFSWLAGNVFDIKAIGKKIVSGDFSRILLLGDSITDGYGGTGYNGEEQREKSINTAGYCWANLFIRYIYNRYGIPVERYGFYGSQMDFQYIRISDVVKSGDLVIWLSGTNNRNSQEDFSAYGINLSGCIRNMQQRGATVLFMPCIPAAEADESARYKTTRDINEVAFRNAYGITHYLDMNSEYMRYCEKNSLAVADTLYDGLHPNDTGYLYIFLILCRALGIPLNFYEDFSQTGSWWAESIDPVYPDDGDGDEVEILLTGISAVYSGGDVPAGIAVTDLSGVVVTAYYSDGSSAPVTRYTISGTIMEGSNVITVSYGGKTTTFTVNCVGTLCIPLTDCVSQCNGAVRGVFVIEHEIPAGTIRKVKVAAQKDGTYPLYFARKTAEKTYTIFKTVFLENVAAGSNEFQVEIPIEEPCYVISTAENGMYKLNPATGIQVIYQLANDGGYPLTEGESYSYQSTAEGIAIGIWFEMTVASVA